jgi:D-lactate dehydrogenase
MTITFFDTHAFEQTIFEQVNAEAGAQPGNEAHILTFLKPALSRETAELARRADVVCVFVNDDVGKQTLDALAELGVKRLALRSAGYNHVDMPHARSLGFRVANVPAYSPYAVAEHTIALMLVLNRKLIRANTRIRDLNFSLDGLVGFDMHGKTAGIVGTGKIGGIVADILHGFGCTLLYYDIKQNTDMEQRTGAAFVDLDTLTHEADIITLHTPLVPETKYIINEQRVAMMKPGVMLINTSRGGLVNTQAVIEGLKSGRIGYLGIDVYELEQGIFFHDFSDTVLQDDAIARLMTFPNVIITAHQAFLTDTALHNIAETTLSNVSSWARGEESANELCFGHS